MRLENQQKVISSLITDMAEFYSLSRLSVEEHLCASLSEVLGSDFGYRVDVDFHNGELNLTGRIFQHGHETDVPISPAKVKRYHLSSAAEVLKRKLNDSETHPLLIKYKPFIRKIVTGRVMRKIGSGYYVRLDGIDDAVIGFCELRYMNLRERGSASGKHMDFYVNSIKLEMLCGMRRVAFMLSRTSREFPCELLRAISGDSKLTVKCDRRVVDRVCYLKTDTYITKKHIERLKAALCGEMIVLSKLTGGSNGRA